MHFSLGKFQIDLLSDGVFWMDGGTVFGVVPRALWGKMLPPDEKNRIPLGLNSLLVRTPDALVLIETGIGNKLNERFRKFHSFAEGRLLDELAARKVSPADIDVVIDTHLHFDHCGWNTVREGGALRTTFPKARYTLQEIEWRDATHPTPLTRGGYHPENILPLGTSGQLQLIHGDVEVVPGIECRLTGGHTPGHQLVMLRSEGKTACFAGDVMCSVHHVRPNYNTAYDLNQQQTYDCKVKLLEEAAEGRWIIVFLHESETPVAFIEKHGDEYVARPPRTK